MTMTDQPPNGMQATPGFALRFFVAQVSRVLLNLTLNPR